MDIKNLIAEMTLEEKAGLLGGDDFWHTKAVERLGLPRFMMSDGPHGLRKQDQEEENAGVNDSIKAVCFPTACATASSFDTELIYKMGETIGEECQAEDLSIVLGPAVNIKRSPLCGRNFEYFSEDPYLAGKMAASFIRGVQSRHVGTSIKHFAVNNQEAYRMSISARVSERALREIYFPPFEISVREAQPKTVMCSYNKINGTYSADNTWLLNDVLRDEWGFEGFVMTDWGAVNDRVQGVRAGLELEMPGNTAEKDRYIVEAVQNGSLDEALVDRAVERILKVLFDYADHRMEDAVFDREKDHTTATEMEKECAVLLQNNGLLPLQEGIKTAYIGEFAEKPRYQGGGSSHINVLKASSALETARRKGRPVSYARGFSAESGNTCEQDLAQAVRAAQDADVAVIFAGLPDVIESEGYDRRDMKLPAGQDAVIEAVLAVQPNTVVVLHNGAPVEVPWAEKCAAILEMYLGGEGVGEAADALLYGQANPCGHLAETFPLRLQDNPSYLNFPGNGKEVFYAEDIYVGYRYYEKKEMPVRWAFGHGLSYTTFSIHNLRLERNDPVHAKFACETETLTGDETLTVRVDVTNTGDRFGKEVVQLYIADQTGMPDRPVKELKGFAKVALEKGETKEVSFVIDKRSLAYYEERIHDWYAPSGTYEILAGSASDSISERVSFQYKASRLLPLHIGPDTTQGELAADPRTAPVLASFSSTMGSSIGQEPDDTKDPDEGLGAGSEEMAKAMDLYMPLKSMMSFGSTEAEVKELVEALKEALGTEG